MIGGSDIARISEMERRARQQAETETWPDGIEYRYLTIAGATIDLRRTHHGDVHGQCGGCARYFHADTDYSVKERVQAHAEKCRALQRPAVTA